MGMIRIAFAGLVAVTLVLGVGLDAAAQKRKRRGKRKAPAPAAQPAEAASEGAAAPEGAPAAEGVAAEESGAEMVVTEEEAEAGAAPAPPAEPEPAPAPEAEQPGGQKAELDALRQELSAVMDELVQARATVSMLGKALFKTRVRVMLEDEAMPDQTVTRVAIYLDGAPIFRGDGSSIPSDPAHPVFEGFAAPGEHELTLELEHRARDDEAYRYSVRNTFRFEVVREHRTDLRLVLDDDSDMADDFADDREGEYDVESRLEVVAEPLK
ncbi:MAG: hypothetical protein OXT09_27855 [Myxococcales bacterium]|nr:hypothetical protein [Myxococcales bacterium]